MWGFCLMSAVVIAVNARYQLLRNTAVKDVPKPRRTSLGKEMLNQTEGGEGLVCEEGERDPCIKDEDLGPEMRVSV